jgi:NAD(P)-dependent dehydrogenase (short-subunit alcohol dehydrogenase family)
MPSAVIIGAGPGIGLSVARRFAREGFDIGLIARTRATLDASVAAVAESGTRTVAATADVADDEALRAALAQLTHAVGVPDVLVYNAAAIQSDDVGELTADQQLDAWAVNVVGAISAVARLAPAMAERGHGTILITGGMPTPIPEVTSLSLGKAGVRALAELLAARYWPAGVHVATITVGGAVEPGGAFDPDEIAEEYWLLHAEPRGHWRREVSYQGGARAAGADTADEIREADAPFFRALLNRDVAALEDLLAEDFVIVEVGTGAVHPRADFIGAVADGLVVFEAIDTDPNETLIRDYGNVAIAIGRTTLTMTAPDGSEIEAASRYSHVFAADGGKWRLVSAQGTAITG